MAVANEQGTPLLLHTEADSFADPPPQFLHKARELPSLRPFIKVLMIGVAWLRSRFGTHRVSHNADARPRLGIGFFQEGGGVGPSREGTGVPSRHRGLRLRHGGCKRVQVCQSAHSGCGIMKSTVLHTTRLVGS